jgi:hypothetical protein
MRLIQQGLQCISPNLANSSATHRDALDNKKPVCSCLRRVFAFGAAFKQLTN